MRKMIPVVLIILCLFACASPIQPPQYTLITEGKSTAPAKAIPVDDGWEFQFPKQYIQKVAITHDGDLTQLALPDVTYYDFTAPRANTLLIVADREDEDTSDSFKILIPEDITVYKRSWGLFTFDTDVSEFKVNDVVIAALGYTPEDWLMQSGKLTPNHLRPGEFHTIQVVNGIEDRCFPCSQTGWTAGGIVLVYEQP